MACIPIPKANLPTLGGGLTVQAPALPSVSLNAGLCCKTVRFTTPPVPVPLTPPGVVSLMNPAFFAAVNAAMVEYQAWIDAQPIQCPLE